MPRMTLAHLTMAAIVALAPATLPAQDTVAVQQVALEKESIQLIDKIEDSARSVHSNLDSLKMHASRNLSRQTNNHHLVKVKESINGELNPALERLIAIKPQLPAWQQATVEKILVSARALATDTNSAFMSLKENASTPVILNDEYRAFLDTMNDHAEKLVTVADATGDYSDALGQALEAGLEVPKHH